MTAGQSARDLLVPVFKLVAFRNGRNHVAAAVPMITSMLL